MKKILIMAIFLSWSLAFSQTTPTFKITEKAVVTYSQSLDVGYERSTNSPQWKNFILLQGFVTKDLTTNKQIYTLKGSPYQISFDPISFSSFYFSTPTAPVLKHETGRQNAEWAVGTSWKTSFVTPPSPGGTISSNPSWQFTFTVIEAKNGILLVNEKETLTSFLTVEGKGYWSNGGYTGKAFQKIVYSPSLEIIISQEALQFDPSGSLNLGRSIFLKSVTIPE